MRHILLKITFAAAAVLLQTSIASACTCAPKRSVLDEYDWAPVVMIARVASLDKAAKRDREDYDYGVRSARLVVDKVYKGDVKVGDEIVFAQGNGTTCVMRFSEQTVGSRMLFYVGRPPDGSQWVVSFCGRSRGVADAAEDLLYLDKLEEVRGKTRISGRYAGGFYGLELRVANRKIRIVGESDSYETTTDDHGVFEIYGVPPGDYRLEPELQPGLIVDVAWLWMSGDAIQDKSTDTYVAFTLKPQKHVSIELGFKAKEQKPATPSRPKI
jgi:hypothetical protein